MPSGGFGHRFACARPIVDIARVSRISSLSPGTGPLVQTPGAGRASPKLRNKKDGPLSPVLNKPVSDALTATGRRAKRA